MGFWRGMGTLSVIFGAVTFLGSLVMAAGAYANQDVAMAGPIGALMGLGIIVGLVFILIGWALKASDKPQPPVIVNQYPQYQQPTAYNVPANEPAPPFYAPAAAPREPVNFCPGCGRQVGPDATYCDGCGRRLS